MTHQQMEKGFYIHLNKLRRRAAIRNAVLNMTPPLLCAGAVVVIVAVLVGWWR